MNENDNSTNAEVSAEETKTENVSEKETSDEKKAPTGKTYTDEEIEKLIQKRLSKELAKQKATADEKAEEALKKIDLLEKRNACLSAGVKPDFADDAITLAGKLVNDKTDFSAALKSVIGKYPQFAGTEKEPDREKKPKFSSGAANIGSKTPNNAARLIMGLPEIK